VIPLLHDYEPERGARSGFSLWTWQIMKISVSINIRGCSTCRSSRRSILPTQDFLNL